MPHAARICFSRRATSISWREGDNQSGGAAVYHCRLRMWTGTATGTGWLGIGGP